MDVLLCYCRYPRTRPNDMPSIDVYSGHIFYTEGYLFTGQLGYIAFAKTWRLILVHRPPFKYFYSER